MTRSLATIGNLRNTIFATLILLMFTASVVAQDNFGADMEPALPEVDARSVLEKSEAKAGETYRVAVVVSMEDPWHINSAYPHQSFLIPAELSFDTVPGVTPHTIAYPDGHDVMLMEEYMSVYSDTVVITFEVDIAKDAAGSIDLPITFFYQACDNNSCAPPDEIAVPLSILIGDNGQPVEAGLFTGGSAVDHGETAPVEQAVEPENDLQKLIDEYGFWGYFIALGVAFVTGLLLSFSPCTYPMIPITVSIFAGQQRSMGRGFVLSLFYVGSMAVIYGIMGLVVSLVGGVFGAWLASAPVVIGMVVIFVVFALSMFGLFELQVPSSIRNKLGTKTGGGGVAGAIVMGAVAALVVSPCVGPFVAGILVYIATSGNPFLGFLILFTFAVGLGTLFMLIGTFSTAINKLPNSGAWMETVKKFFGFILLLMAVYFLQPIVPVYVTALLFAILLLSFAVFGGGLDRLTSESGGFARLKKFLGILAFILGAYLLLGLLMTQGFIHAPASEWIGQFKSVDSQEKSLIPWEEGDLQTSLDRAKAEGKPVLIDTWATWCTNCKILEKKTFGNVDVANEAKRFFPVKVQLENQNTPITQDFMKRFGMKHYSLPTTLLLDSQGNVVKVLQGVVPPDEMIAAMQQVK